MDSRSLDDVDQGILYLLQENARRRTTVEIGESVGVSSSTVASRITDLEDRGVIQGYYLTIDYEKTDLTHHFLAFGTVPFDDLSAVVDEIMAVDGVVSTRELLTNDENVTVEFVGRTRDDVESTLSALDSLGVDIERMEMMKRERTQPYNHFGQQYTAAGDG